MKARKGRTSAAVRSAAGRCGADCAGALRGGARGAGEAHAAAGRAHCVRGHTATKISADALSHSGQMGMATLRRAANPQTTKRRRRIKNKEEKIRKEENARDRDATLGPPRRLESH